MRKLARPIAAATLALAAAPAAALLPWGGAGWYLMETLMDEPELLASAVEGPFSDEQACRVRMKAWQQDAEKYRDRVRDGEEYYDYFCSYEGQITASFD